MSAMDFIVNVEEVYRSNGLNFIFYEGYDNSRMLMSGIRPIYVTLCFPHTRCKDLAEIIQICTTIRSTRVINVIYTSLS